MFFIFVILLSEGSQILKTITVTLHLIDTYLQFRSDQQQGVPNLPMVNKSIFAFNCLPVNQLYK